MFLDEDQVVELTKKRRHDAQARALRFMGIEFKPRPDGSLAVLRARGLSWGRQYSRYQ